MNNIRLVILFCLIFFGSCKKTVPYNQTPNVTIDVFSNNTNTIVNGQKIQFELLEAGRYYLKLYDTTSNQIVTKEKFNGVVGKNIKKIYTTTFSQKNLYLFLTDSLGNDIKKTKITMY